MNGSEIRRKRLIEFTLLNGGILLVSLLYALAYLVCERRGIDLFSCRFARVTGFYCPGCGGSRALMSLLRFDFPATLRYYPPMVLAVVLIAIFDVRLLLDAVKKTDRYVKAAHPKLFLLIPIAMLVVFFVRLILVLAFHIDPLGDLK